MKLKPGLGASTLSCHYSPAPCLRDTEQWEIYTHYTTAAYIFIQIHMYICISVHLRQTT